MSGVIVPLFSLAGCEGAAQLKDMLGRMRKSEVGGRDDREYAVLDVIATSGIEMPSFLLGVSSSLSSLLLVLGRVRERRMYIISHVTLSYPEFCPESLSASAMLSCLLSILKMTGTTLLCPTNACLKMLYAP